MHSHPFGRLFLLIQHNINKATLIGLYDYFESSRPLMRADIDAIAGNDVQTGDSGTFTTSPMSVMAVKNLCSLLLISY